MIQIPVLAELATDDRRATEQEAVDRIRVAEDVLGGVGDFLEELVFPTLALAGESLCWLPACSCFPITWDSNSRIGMTRPSRSSPSAAPPRSTMSRP